MSTAGRTYAKRPCRGCGAATTVRLHIRVRGMREDRTDGETLASHTVTLCDQCAFGLYVARPGRAGTRTGVCHPGGVQQHLPTGSADQSPATGRPSTTEPSSLVADGSRRRATPGRPLPISGSPEGTPTTLQDAPKRGDEALTSAEASVMARGTGRLAGNAAVSGTRVHDPARAPGAQLTGPCHADSADADRAESPRDAASPAGSRAAGAILHDPLTCPCDSCADRLADLRLDAEADEALEEDGE